MGLMASVQCGRVEWPGKRLCLLQLAMDHLTWQPEEPENGTETLNLHYPRLSVSHYILQYLSKLVFMKLTLLLAQLQGWFDLQDTCVSLVSIPSPAGRPQSPKIQHLPSEGSCLGSSSLGQVSQPSAIEREIRWQSMRSRTFQFATSD